MQENDRLFAGSIPELYDRYLGPLIFEPYARDLAARLATLKPAHVLETAAGTGVATRALTRALPSSVTIVATDLVWGFACQALTIAAPPSSAACSRSMTGDDDRRGACLGARGVAPQPCIRSARGEAGP